MKKWIAVTVAVLAGCSALALLGGCNLALGRTAHTWEESWSNAQLSDGTYSHWHACLDENCNSRDQYARCTFELVEETTPSSCSVAGEGKYECTVCGNVVTMPLPLAAHTWEIVAREVQETCFSNGYGQWKCAECGAPRNDAGYDSNGYGSIPATGEHSLEEGWTSDKDGHYHACTNTKREQNGTVTNCTYKADFAPHTEGEPETISATQTRDGKKTWRCTQCGYVTRTENLPALNTPVDFEMLLTPTGNWAPQQVHIGIGEDGKSCHLYFGMKDSSTEQKYTVTFVSAKNAVGDAISTSGWAWDEKTGRGIKVYRYNDSGAGTYNLVDLNSSPAKYYNGTFWFISVPSGNQMNLVFRYITIVDGEEIVRAEKWLYASVQNINSVSAVSTLAPLPDPYNEKKRK